MKTEQIHSLTETFEGHAQQTENGVEYWLARDLQHLLGYSKWENFQTVIAKAKTACEVSGHDVENHFPDVRKMVQIGSGTEREIDDLMLTRYACYLIAQNGDPRKEEIAFAQTYFAIQTRRAELIVQRLLEAERVQTRQKLTATEKELSAVIFEQTGGNQDFATMILSFGLFRLSSVAVVLLLVLAAVAGSGALYIQISATAFQPFLATVVVGSIIYFCALVPRLTKCA